MSENMLTNQSQTDSQIEDLNFTAFTDLCRFCSLRVGPKYNLFDKDSENRQLLFKLRSFLPTTVTILPLNLLYMYIETVRDY